MKNVTNAFTLAEILIALAIIGVVAALTIPTVVTRYREKQIVSALKKFYSEISNAYNLAIVKNGSPSTWGWTYGTGAGSEHIMDILAPYLRISKRCGVGGQYGKCFGDNKYKTLNPNIDWSTNLSTSSSYSTAKLDNGFSIWILSYSTSCDTEDGTTKALQNICGNIGVDINGEKAPNALGRDTFYFDLTKYGVVPKGTKEGIGSTLENRCNISSTNAKNGFACAAWVIAKGNMDYLRKNVSW